MKQMFRPHEKSVQSIMKLRRQGYSNNWTNYNFVNRAKWYPAGWKYNQRVIGSMHSRLHYLACHAPAPVCRKWRATYNNFMIKHFGANGKGTMHYLNKWSAHSWL
jgi:hypothetical protein